MGWRLGEKKAQGPRDGAFLDWALEAFAGDVAVDARYEGPSCVLSAVDHRQDKRMLDAVLEHDPTHDDIKALLGRLKTAVDARDVVLHGMTTEGSALYPEPISAVLGDVPHQLCTFHGRAARVKGILRALASERKRLETSRPKVQRGRPSSKNQEARRVARKSNRIQQKISDVFQHRFVFVKRHLSPSERHRRMSITRGWPHLRKLREIMAHLSALFDRRCRTHPARGKLRKRRHWVKRFQWIGDTRHKVCSPHLEQALTCLDDKLFPATANAVERGNRRHRTMQKSVYRVRSKVC